MHFTQPPTRFLTIIVAVQHWRADTLDDDFHHEFFQEEGFTMGDLTARWEEVARVHGKSLKPRCQINWSFTDEDDFEGTLSIYVCMD